METFLVKLQYQTRRVHSTKTWQEFVSGERGIGIGGIFGRGEGYWQKKTLRQASTALVCVRLFRSTPSISSTIRGDSKNGFLTL